MPTELLTKRPVPARETTSSGGGGGGSGPAGRWAPAGGATAFTAVGMVIVAVAMLFVAFTTMYAARRQEADWASLVIPPVLWLNSAVLLASSGTLEWARRRLRLGDASGLQQGLAWTAALGGVFVIGQYVGWRELAAQGIYLATNPHSSFYYLLTGAHGLHLLGGLTALGAVLVRARAGRYTPEEHTGLNVCTLYWHFMDALWLYVFGLLFWA